MFTKCISNLFFKVLHFIVGLSYVVRKCTVNVIIMSLIMKMCRTHQIYDATGNFMCPSLENAHEISDVT